MNQKNLTIKHIAPDQFLRMGTEWNALLSQTSVETPFLRWEWVAEWWRAFEKNQKLAILGVYQDDQLVGIAPFTIRVSSTRLGFKTLEFCSASDLYPDYLDVIALPGLEKDIVHLIFDFLNKNKKEWDFISLDNLLSDSILLRYAPTSMAGWQRDVRETSECPFIELKGSMEEYMKAHFKKKKRYNLNRQARLVFEDQGLTLEKGTDIQSFLELHERRAAQKGIRSSIVSKEVKDFLFSISDHFNERGLLEMWFLKKDNVPVSVIYGFKTKDTFYFYQSGVDPAWDRWSAGTVLLMQMIEKAFDWKLAKFDFLKGDEDYKKTWNTGVTKEVRLRIYRNDWLGHFIRNTHRLISLYRRARS